MADDAIYLRAILTALTRHIAGDLRDPQAADSANLAKDILRTLVIRMEAADLAADYVSGGAALSRSLGLDGAGAGPSQVAARHETADVDHWRSRLGEAVEALAGSREEVGDKLRAIAQLDLAYLGALRERDAALQAVAPESGDAAGEIDVEQLTDYLRRRFPDHSALSVLRVVEVPGGGSKRTLLLSLAPNDLFPGELVMRQEVQHNFLGNDLAHEHRVLTALRETDLPIAHPLLFEDQATALGPPFLLFPRLAGRTVGDLWGFRVTEGAREVALSLAALLARLHSLDVARLGLAEGTADRRRLVLNQIETLERRWKQLRRDASPALALGFSWLYRHLDPAMDGTALVHGDASLPNLLVEGVRIAGLIDWEYAHPGDPAEDLAYIRGVVSAVLPWPEFIAAYREAGGAAIDERRLRYFDIWGAVRNCIAAVAAGESFVKGESDRLRLAMAGLFAVPLLEHRILSVIIDDIGADR